MKVPQIDQGTTCLLDQLISTDSTKGLAIRLIEKVFKLISRKSLDVTISLSCMLIQHENIIDLLPKEESSLGTMQSLRVTELSR